MQTCCALQIKVSIDFCCCCCCWELLFQNYMFLCRFNLLFETLLFFPVVDIHKWNWCNFLLFPIHILSPLLFLWLDCQVVIIIIIIILRSSGIGCCSQFNQSTTDQLLLHRRNEKITITLAIRLDLRSTHHTCNHIMI